MGLPSAERVRLFLKPDQMTPEFFHAVEQVRANTYEKIGINPIAQLGRVSREGKRILPRLVSSN